jgi:hypothetical protein
MCKRRDYISDLGKQTASGVQSHVLEGKQTDLV